MVIIPTDPLVDRITSNVRYGDAVYLNVYSARPDKGMYLSLTPSEARKLGKHLLKFAKRAEKRGNV